MTNLERWKDKMLQMHGKISVIKGKPFLCYCMNCSCCDLKNDNQCEQNFIRWLADEYKKPEVDWSKVPVDSKVLVSKNGNNWEKRHFAKYKNGKVYTWPVGTTSWSTSGDMASWSYAELVDEDELNDQL